jgi:hypothetical protein
MRPVASCCEPTDLLKVQIIYNNNNNIYLLQMGCHPVAVTTVNCVGEY